MFSNDQPSNLRRTHGDSPKSGQRAQEITLFTQGILIERKEFSLALKENSRGRFIRIVESNGNYFASIIVPANGLADFQRLLTEMIKADKEIPIKIESKAKNARTEK
jgi:hypothetical protein